MCYARFVKKRSDDYSDDEAAKRAEEAIRRSFTLPHKPRKSVVGTTPRAKSMARAKAAKEKPKSRG